MLGDLKRDCDFEAAATLVIGRFAFWAMLKMDFSTSRERFRVNLCWNMRYLCKAFFIRNYIHNKRMVAVPVLDLGDTFPCVELSGALATLRVLTTHSGQDWSDSSDILYSIMTIMYVCIYNYIYI